MARDVIPQLLATDVACDKLGALVSSAQEAGQLPRIATGTAPRELRVSVEAVRC